MISTTFASNQPGHMRSAGTETRGMGNPKEPSSSWACQIQVSHRLGRQPTPLPILYGRVYPTPPPASVLRFLDLGHGSPGSPGSPWRSPTHGTSEFSLNVWSPNSSHGRRPVFHGISDGKRGFSIGTDVDFSVGFHLKSVEKDG